MITSLGLWPLIERTLTSLLALAYKLISFIITAQCSTLVTHLAILCPDSLVGEISEETITTSEY